jgi:hypothetical protein
MKYAVKFISNKESDKTVIDFQKDVILIKNGLVITNITNTRISNGHFIGNTGTFKSKLKQAYAALKFIFSS